MDEAIHVLSSRVAAHLAPNERAHVTSRNLTALSPVEVNRAQASFERSLRRNLRNPAIVEVALTFSDNVKGFLVIAEIRRGEERVVEMSSFRKDPSAIAAPKAIVLSKKLIWEQQDAILDLAIIGDQMLVLEQSDVARYQRPSSDSGGRWERMQTTAIPMHPARDPRGRLEINGDTIIAHVPGSICRGALSPLALQCEAGGMFASGRNTLSSEDLPSHFSLVQVVGLSLLAEMDDRTHVYDSSRKAVSVFDSWGSDFILISGGCAANRIAATSSGTRDAVDSIALYELAGNQPVTASDSVQLPGPVKALWPARDGAVAIVRNLSLERYEAYSITADCSR